MRAHPIDDAIWGHSDPSNVSIDTTNSAEIMVGSHIMEDHMFIFRRSDQHELLNMAARVPCKDDLSQYYEIDFLDNYHDWNKSPDVIDTVNSGANIAGAYFVNQEHQNCYE